METPHAALGRNPPAAPSPSPLPLPTTPQHAPLPFAAAATSPTSNISYESISASDRSVFHHKVERYRNWTQDVTRHGGVHVSESSLGGAGGVGAASWGSLPTTRVESRDGTEPSTIIQRRDYAREALIYPNGKTKTQGQHYVPLVITESRPLPTVLPQASRPTAASRIVDTPASMTQPATLPHVPPMTQTLALSRKSSQQPARRVSPTPYLAKPQITREHLTPSPPAVLVPPSRSHERLDVPQKPHSDHRSSDHSGHSVHSVYQEREAYLNSALHLPMEMLSERQSPAPVPQTGVKSWTSLLRKNNGTRGQGQNQPRFLSGPAAITSSAVLKTNVPGGLRMTRSHTIGTDTSASKAEGAKTVTGPSQSALSVPAQGKVPLQSRDLTRKPLPEIRLEDFEGSQSHPDSAGTMAHSLEHGLAQIQVPALGSFKSHRARRIESALNSSHIEIPNHRHLQVEAKVPTLGSSAPSVSASRLGPGDHTMARGDTKGPALGSSSSHRAAPVDPADDFSLNHTHLQAATKLPAMGSTSSQRREQSTNHDLHAPYNTPTQVKLSPTPNPTRQQLPVTRPALSRSISSIDGLTKTLGRRFRDPSLTNLTARFEPQMYSLPDSLTPEISPVKAHRTVTPRDMAPFSTIASATRSSTRLAPAAHENEPRDRSPHDVANLHDFVDHSHPSLAERRSRPIVPVRVQPELFHPKPLSAVPTRQPETPLLSPQLGIRQHDRSPMRIRSPSDSRDVSFSPMTGVDHQEAVHFEVPSGSNGRLRVSVAWSRDRQRRRRAEEGSGDLPPPLPPKGPPSKRSRRTRNETQRPSQPYSGPSSPRIPAAQSPPPMQGFYNPYLLPLPAYSPPPLQQVYQMQHSMKYSQPGMPYGSWPRRTYQPPSIRPSSPLRPPSVEPPFSDGSSPAELLRGPIGISPWYPQGGPVPASQYPGQGAPRQERQGMEQNSIWRRMFGRQDPYSDRRGADPVSQWRSNVHQAPSVVPSVMSRGPITAPVYREPRHRLPRSRKAPWWRPGPTELGTTYERDPGRRRQTERSPPRFRSRDARRQIGRDDSSVWDIFRRRTEGVHMRSPRWRDAPLPPSAAPGHLAPNRIRMSPVRRDRPRLRERWSSRNRANSNGNAKLARQDPGTFMHIEKQRQKAERRAATSQRRSEREQRRQPTGGAGIFNGQQRHGGSGGRGGLFRDDARRDGGARGQHERDRGGNERVRRARDVGVVSQWTRAISKFIPGRNDRAARR